MSYGTKTRKPVKKCIMYTHAIGRNKKKINKDTMYEVVIFTKNKQRCGDGNMVKGTECIKTNTHLHKNTNK